MWSYRDLTYIGKVTVIKTLALPILVQSLTVLPNPQDSILNDIEKIFYKFLWNKGQDKEIHYYPLQTCLVFMFFPLHCVSFGLRLLITPSNLSCLYVLPIVLCVLRFTASDYPFKLFLSLLSYHCIVCPSIYGF